MKRKLEKEMNTSGEVGKEPSSQAAESPQPPQQGLTFKERRSPKLKSVEYVLYDSKGAAFILAPFGSRTKELAARVPEIVRAVNAHDALVALAERIYNEGQTMPVEEIVDQAAAALALATKPDNGEQKG